MEHWRKMGLTHRSSSQNFFKTCKRRNAMNARTQKCPGEYLQYIHLFILIRHQNIFCFFESWYIWTSFYDNISECIPPWLSPWFHWQFLITCTFPISLKFGECYIKCQWVEFSVKNAFLCLHIHFCHFCCFLSQICVFMILWFSFFFLFFFFFLSFCFFVFFVLKYQISRIEF